MACVGLFATLPVGAGVLPDCVSHLAAALPEALTLLPDLSFPIPDVPHFSVPQSYGAQRIGPVRPRIL